MTPAVTEPVLAQRTTMAVGAGIGVGRAPRNGRDAATLLRHAGQRMDALRRAVRRSG